VDSDGPKIVLNSGLAVGAVIGSDRLTFEIFGEAVSTAMELLKAMPARGIIATQRFTHLCQLSGRSTANSEERKSSGATDHPGNVAPTSVFDSPLTNHSFWAGQFGTQKGQSITSNENANSLHEGSPLMCTWSAPALWRIRGGRSISVLNISVSAPVSK
jgi:hypothetical protein